MPRSRNRIVLPPTSYSLRTSMIHIEKSTEQSTWDSFLSRQTYRPFLQSWTMGDVYRDCGQEPVRLAAMDGTSIVGICQAIFVPARRGKHLAVLYGPVVERQEATAMLIDALKEEAKKRNCSFLRISPFAAPGTISLPPSLPSPLHTLAEHVWYMPLQNNDPWNPPLTPPLRGTPLPRAGGGPGVGGESEILSNR